MNAQKYIESGYLPSVNGHIYVSRHPAQSGGDGKHVMMVSPHVEERKSSYRLMYEMAEMLSQAGWNVYRFDPRGVGESTGSHRELTLDRWIADCQIVADECAEASNLWLIGARLGANVAVKAATDIPAVKGVVLWEPLLTGEAYLRDMVRRKQIKEMMGQGQAESAEDALESVWANGDSVDFDGFEMGPGLRAELADLALEKDLEPVSGKNLLICHTSGARTFSGPWAGIPAMVKPPSQAVCIRQKPFWGLLDYQENLELKETTLGYMEAQG